MRVRRLIVGALILLTAALAWHVSRLALDADAVREGVLALPRNAPLAAHGLERRELDLGLPGLVDPVSVSWIHVPSRRAGAPTLVLVHGTPSTLSTWTQAIWGGAGGTALVDHFEVYALELLDHGFGPAADGSASFTRCAHYVAAFLDALDLHAVVLVGQSYGGEFAWQAALDHPERVGRLVLVDSSGLPRPDDGWLPEEEAMRELPGAGLGWLLNSRENIAGALQPHFAEPVTTDLVEEVFLVCSRPAGWRAMVDLARDENGARAPELSGLVTPTLLIWGERDEAYPVERYGREFERRLPDARLVVISDCGHYPQEERPTALVQALVDFAAD